jgi:hypothetical protein
VLLVHYTLRQKPHKPVARTFFFDQNLIDDLHMAGLPLFARYSQKENLTDRLRGILDDYPPGLGPWKEVRLSVRSAAVQWAV